MRLWRISNYADLSGMGGVRFAARWHSKGRPILYAAEHPAGALTEFLTHLGLEDIPDAFQLITMEVPEAAKPGELRLADLPPDWTSNRATTRAIGDGWLKGGSSLLLRVPSVLVPDAFNMLVNPQHPDAAGLRILKTEQVPLDQRLVRG